MEGIRFIGLNALLTVTYIINKSFQSFDFFYRKISDAFFPKNANFARIKIKKQW